MHVGIDERRALIVLASIALHIVVLGWLAWRHERTRLNAEPAAVNVEIVRLPRITQHDRPASAPRSAEARAPTAAPQPDAPAPAPRSSAAPEPGAPGPAIDPRWTVDLNSPVFEDGKWPRPAKPSLERPRCDPWADPDRMTAACRRELAVARQVTHNMDPQNGRDDMAREARHKESMRSYRDAPGTSGYPGLRCALLHRC